MAEISFIKPLDQPLGTKRLLSILQEGLQDPGFTRLRIIVAYAKSGPLLRLQSDIESWREAGKSIVGIIGIDQQGTSQEALTIAVSLFNELYVTRERGITFHPKIYFFDGPTKAKAIIGSNNLTVGGTETNFESAVLIDLIINEDVEVYSELEAMWNKLLPGECIATRLADESYIDTLVNDSFILSEMQGQMRTNLSTHYPEAPKSGLKCKPASPLPINVLKPATQQGAVLPLQPPVSGLAIQIKPHHNGEIFLSKIAVMQNPTFFGWPFTGKTVPKKKGNPAYPQRSPDPIVNVDVYGASLTPVLSLRGYSLNTVYYDIKSEIRVTASPLVSEVPEYSVMVMTLGQTQGIDYEILIYRPDSPDYDRWVGACNQRMPGGGKAPRRFGWF